MMRAKYQRLDRLGRTIHRFGDFRIFKLLVSLHYNRGSLPVWQCLDRLADLLQTRLVEQHLFRGRPSICEWPLRITLQTGAQAQNVAFTAVVALPVQRQVIGNAEQPTGELRSGLITGSGTIDTEKDTLGQLFRNRAVSDEPIDVLNHRASITLAK